MQNTELRKPIEYIKEALRIYTKKENFIFFARVMAILTIVSTVLGYLMTYLYQDGDLNTWDFDNILKTILLVLVSILIAVLGVYTRAVTLVSVLNINADIKQLFIWGWKKTWKYFLISLLVGIIIGVGILLLIIPGIIFGIWYSFATFLVIDNNLKIKDALKQSKVLVVGRFWKVLGRFVVFGIFGLLLTLVLGIFPYAGNILIAFAAPLFILPSYLLYKDLTV